MRAFLAASIIACALACPNKCTQRGFCDAGRCVCENGFTGADCSSRLCPAGPAWTDAASATDVAHHAYAECSNMGLCERATGVCRCRAGFSGVACQRMECPSNCNGHGACLSMSEAARFQDDRRLFRTTTYGLWDADRVRGCVCDRGYTGYDCSLRTCPAGDDPATTGQAAEVQTVTCTCAATCSGHFAVTLRGASTGPIPHDASAATLKAALDALPDVRQTSVALAGGGTTVCSAAGQDAAVTFHGAGGDMPLLSLHSALASTGAAPTLTVVETTAGTEEASECNGRGLCDRGTGKCACFTGYGPTAGATLTVTVGSAASVVPAAPYRGCGVITVAPTDCPNACSGQGTCSGAPAYTCACHDGFTGADCSQRACPLGSAWFDEATGPDAARALTECSAMGVCDRGSGVCVCRAGWEGSACERLACPAGATALPCSGHGRCRSMAELAATARVDGVPAPQVYGSAPGAADTWDARRLQGCACDETFHTFPDGRVGDVSDYSAFDCSVRSCPLGDDPYRPGVFEVQTLTCGLGSGTFTLAFRGHTTAAIAFDATLDALQTALTALPTIGNASVTSTGATACSGAAVSVTFFSELGDVPLLVSSSGSAVVAEETKGTKARLVCSGNGLCDTATGSCKCFSGWGASDANGNQGFRPDCGAR